MIKDGILVQSMGFNKYLPIGHPKTTIEFISRWNVDEIIVLDISDKKKDISLTNGLLKLISKNCFVPIAVGGGIQTIEHAKSLISSGADKIVLNTHAFKENSLVTQISDQFGSQCVVGSIDAKIVAPEKYRAFIENGKIDTKMNVTDWAKKLQILGAGEIFLNSIDRDGSKLGYDLKLIERVKKEIDIPLIACGGVGKFSDFSDAVLISNADACAAGNIFHFVEHSTILAKANMFARGINVRLDNRASYINRSFDSDGRLLMLEGQKLKETILKRGSLDIL